MQQNQAKAHENLKTIREKAGLDKGDKFVFPDEVTDYKHRLHNADIEFRERSDTTE